MTAAPEDAVPEADSAPPTERSTDESTGDWRIDSADEHAATRPAHAAGDGGHRGRPGRAPLGASDIIAPAFLALVMIILVQPLRDRMSERIPAWLSATICVIAVYLIIVGLALALLVATARFAALLPTYKDEFGNVLDSLETWLGTLGVDSKQIQEVLSDVDLSQLGSIVGDLLTGALGLASNLVFILMLVLFMGMDAGAFARQLVAARPERGGSSRRWGRSRRARGPTCWCRRSSGSSSRCSTRSPLAIAAASRVPLLWGLLAFITNYIPNIGFVIGLIPPAVLGPARGRVRA